MKRAAQVISVARRRALLSAVKKTFARTAVGRGRTPDERAFVARARSLFLSAGSAQLDDGFADERWLQLVVEFRGDAQADAFLGRQLAAAVRGWISSGTVREFAFVRKAPGVRLRFLSAASGDAAREKIVRYVARARARGDVADYAFGLYEPESHQFGGREGIRLFHRFSTIDSLTSLSALSIVRAKEGRLARSALSLLLIGTMLDVAVPGGAWEQWDVWCNMRYAKRTFTGSEPGQVAARKAIGANRALLSVLANDREQLVGQLTRKEQALLAAYRAFKSGHGLNNRLVRTLLADPSAWEIVTFADESKAPAGLAELAPAW